MPPDTNTPAPPSEIDHREPGTESTAEPEELAPETRSRKPRPPEPTRRRRSLNLTLQTDELWQRIATFEHCSITEALRRSLVTRWKIHQALHPELEWPTLTPEALLEAGQEPERLAFVGVRSGRVREIEIL